MAEMSYLCLIKAPWRSPLLRSGGQATSRVTRLRGATVPIGYFSCSLAKTGSVAQLYSASDFGSEGWGLESLRGHKRRPLHFEAGFFIFRGVRNSVSVSNVK